MTYTALKEIINEQIELEKENYNEARNIAGVNCAGACLASGALDAYNLILKEIEVLEK